MLSLTSGRNFQTVKGVVESLVSFLNPAARLETADYGCELLDPAQSCQLRLDDQVLGYLGSVRPEGLKQFDLRTPTIVAELKGFTPGGHGPISCPVTSLCRNTPPSLAT